MSAEAEIAALNRQVQQLQSEIEDLRHSGERGSKAEAMTTLQYESRLDTYEAPNAIDTHRDIQIASFSIILLVHLIFFAIIGIVVWHDYEDKSFRDEEYRVLGVQHPDS